MCAEAMTCVRSREDPLPCVHVADTRQMTDRQRTVLLRRDSKLTRVLQGSLSGAGARIAVVACVTPASSQAEETHNTLKFAMRAKKVRDQG